MSAARVLLLLLATPLAVAHADGTTEPDLDPDTEVARKHFAKGSEHYRMGAYELALHEFETSRRAKKLPPLDYNIGRCLDRLERYPEAVEAYKRYLDAAPGAADAAEVRERVRTLEERLAEEQLARQPKAAPPTPPPAPALTPAVTPVPAPPAAPDRSARASLLLPLLVGGVAVAAAGSALALFYGSVVPDFNALASGPTSCRPCDPSQYADVQTRANVSYALGVAAVVVAAVDVVLWIYTRGRM